MSTTLDDPIRPSSQNLETLFLQKHGHPDQVGWAPRRRFRFGYYLPSDWYEAVVQKHVTPGCCWIDMGGGSHIFPENAQLAHVLVSRCSYAVAVDPSDNVLSNEFILHRVRCRIEEYQNDRLFDLATLRMVVEHVSEPEGVVRALQRLLRPGGLAIILTVNLWSPVTILSRLVPFGLHHPLKRLIWGGAEKDTFPVHYKMNTRRILLRLLSAHGFQERAFLYLDDLSIFGHFKLLNYIELTAWRTCRTLGLSYPENCLLGVYQKSL